MTASAWTRSEGPPPDHAARDLTEREREVLGLLCAGHSARQMARRLGITEPTVRKHLEHVYHKLGAHDRVVAVLRAQRLRLVVTPGDEVG